MAFPENNSHRLFRFKLVVVFFLEFPQLKLNDKIVKRIQKDLGVCIWLISFWKAVLAHFPRHQALKCTYKFTIFGYDEDRNKNGNTESP
jgi:hypothetical protein